MEWLTDPLKTYRRYRFERRYDSPLFFFVLDFTIGLIQILAVVGFFLIIWVIASRYTDTSTPTQPQTTESAQVVSDTKIGTREVIPAVAVATQSASVEPSEEQTNALQQVPEIALAANIDNKPNDNKTIVQTESVQQQDEAIDVSTIVNHEWVLEQSSDKFTIQFRSSRDVEILREFAPVITSETTVSIFPFKKTNNGQMVFGIATGLYESLEEAAAAIETMAPAAQEFGPWIRPLDELQREVSDTVVVPE